MQIILRILLLVFLSVSVLAPSVATAQTATEEVEKKPLDKRKLLVPPRNADGSIVSTAFTDDPVQWMKDQQRSFYGSMRKSLQQLATGSRSAATWSLFWISFLYGIFHAAGPGHGKAVVTSWILATENDLKRGFIIAFMSAMIQALTAIIAVSVILFLFQGGAAMARNAAGLLESASFAMIAAMGLYLIWTVFKPHHHEHKEHEHHDHAHHHHDHDHHHHVHDETCDHGHAHAPSPVAVRGDWSLAKAFSLAFAVGIRPCTGAILVLVFSYTIGLYWAGIASTLAMGVGVFLTISAIAALSVYAKSFALKFAGHDNQRMAFYVNGLRLAGGIVIFGLGALLFLGSLGDQSAMM